jgi:hypothetical protein
LAAWAVALSAGTVYAADPVPPAQFDALHRMIKPLPREEKWAEIPWMTSLWDARQRAAREGKPILLWEMDGHPMGCV